MAQVEYLFSTPQKYISICGNVIFKAQLQARFGSDIKNKNVIPFTELLP